MANADIDSPGKNAAQQVDELAQQVLTGVVSEPVAQSGNFDLSDTALYTLRRGLGLVPSPGGNEANESRSISYLVGILSEMRLTQLRHASEEGTSYLYDSIIELAQGVCPDNNSEDLTYEQSRVLHGIGFMLWAAEAEIPGFTYRLVSSPETVQTLFMSGLLGTQPLPQESNVGQLTEQIADVPNSDLIRRGIVAGWNGLNAIQSYLQTFSVSSGE